MGSACFKGAEAQVHQEFQVLHTGLVSLLKELSPEELLILATTDPDIYEICKNNATLRMACIYAAVRKYQIEKHFSCNVNNRTADFMTLLDTFLEIQDDEDAEELQAQNKVGKAGACRWCTRRHDNSENDENGSSQDEEMKTTT